MINDIKKQAEHESARKCKIFKITFVLVRINEQIRKMTKKEGIARTCYNGSATNHKTQEGMPYGNYSAKRADTQILFRETF